MPRFSNKTIVEFIKNEKIFQRGIKPLIENFNMEKCHFNAGFRKSIQKTVTGI